MTTGAGPDAAQALPRIRRVAIIGTGLMGGSLGLACIKSGLVDEVAGYDADPRMAQRALAKGALTRVATQASEAARDADLVVIATPVGSIAETFRQIAPLVAADTIVTDVGSTKKGVVEEIEALDGPSCFIGGHPMAGSESEGIEAADAGLYEGCVWVLTPTARTDHAPYSRLVRFLSSLGARVVSLDPGRHDEAMALTSHLPQLVSSTLMRFAFEVTSAEEGLPMLSAGGFQDMTRIAGSPPDLWVGIVQENQRAVLVLLERFRAALGGLAGAIETGDWEAVRNLLEDARRSRKILAVKPGIQGEELVEIRVRVPDRAGVLAEITTGLGEAGVNIEDIDILHAPEGGKGVVHLMVKGRQSAGKAAGVLSQKGYSPDTG